MKLVGSLAESILARLEKENIVKIPASLEEFWELLPNLEGQTVSPNYIDEEIVVTMSFASEPHEIVLLNLLKLISLQYDDKEDYRVVPSGRVVYIPDCQTVYNPDGIVIKGKTELFPRKRQMVAMLNPHTIIEVQSSSTEKVDFWEKLPCYKKIESIKYIIYVSPKKPFVTVYSKTMGKNHWINDDYDTLEDSVKIDDFEIPMKEIYRKISFESLDKKSI